jgi:K+-sensing histidine kinase KdpD
VTVETDCLVQLDPRLTAAALAHLLENAVQYAPATSRVDIVAGVDGGELLLRVRDRGPGIAAADLPHLFERFYRGSSAKVHPSGTGMGLSIARGFLAAEGGRVWAENCRDGGAQFTIAVPAAMKQADAAVASSA